MSRTENLAPAFSQKFTETNHDHYVKGCGQYVSYPAFFFDFIGQKTKSPALIGFATMLWKHTYTKCPVGAWSLSLSKMAQVTFSSRSHVIRCISTLNALGAILVSHGHQGEENRYAWNVEMFKTKREWCLIETGVVSDWNGGSVSLESPLVSDWNSSYLVLVLIFKIKFFLNDPDASRLNGDNSQPTLWAYDDAALAASLPEGKVAAWIAAVESVSANYDPALIECVLTHYDIDFVKVQDPEAHLRGVLDNVVVCGRLLFENPGYELTPAEWLNGMVQRYGRKPEIHLVGGEHDRA